VYWIFRRLQSQSSGRDYRRRQPLGSVSPTSRLSTDKMLRRLSEWQVLNGESYHGTPWDPQDRDWQPGGVEYDWGLTEDGMWVLQSSSYRVVEIYYNVEDKDLPQYVDPHVETSFLSALPDSVVESNIWPHVIHGFEPIQSIRAMAQLRRVCKGWKSSVDHNIDW
jgi:hypothetical protein